ncbi:MAG TPA: hypothetical protein VG963_21900, partial [Polyangiaceae bacterium]|nr:hypothetical protein [Polyangiaceae bacterium]
QDIAARARFAGSCIGCHQESSGAFLGAGVSAPFQFDFVHVSERAILPCDDGSGNCFAISDALRSSFLPHRQQVMASLLGSGSCAGAPPAFAASSSASLGSLTGTPSAALRTLGGQIASPHGH